MSQESSSVTSAPVRLTGRVKWFNNKTGFGFISVVGGNDQFKDASEVFAHHSAISVSQEQYRYLVEGEYVEFSVVTNESGEHKFQAGDVRGVKGGKLFCETRHEHRGTATGKRVVNTSRDRDQSEGHREYQSRGGYGGRGRGGRVAGGRGGRGGGEWMLVRRDQHERQDGSQYRHKTDRASSSQSGSRSQSHPSPAASQAQAQAQAQAQEHSQSKPSSSPTSHAQSEDGGKTPRTQTARKPRQAKPSA
jgi:CspA family cold shock protein